MSNTRFATAIHILTILSRSEETWCSSDWIAGSVNVNPVVIRRELLALKEAGLVESKIGKDGGCRLARKSEDIRISDVYMAVKNSEVLGRKNLDPNPKCEVGMNINGLLTTMFEETDQVVVKYLSEKTLGDFVRNF